MVAVLLQQLVLQVDTYFAVFTRLESVTLERHAVGCRKLSFYAGFYKINRVVTNLCHFRAFIHGYGIGIEACVWQESEVV